MSTEQCKLQGREIYIFIIYLCTCLEDLSISRETSLILSHFYLELNMREVYYQGCPIVTPFPIGHSIDLINFIWYQYFQTES